jgi:hypothetical protein
MTERQTLYFLFFLCFRFIDFSFIFLCFCFSYYQIEQMHKLIDTMKSKLNTKTSLHNINSATTIQISNSTRSNASDNMKQRINDLTII